MLYKSHKIYNNILLEKLIDILLVYRFNNNKLILFYIFYVLEYIKYKIKVGTQDVYTPYSEK